jgi:thiol-disulfide isomerase/thioredoxin
MAARDSFRAAIRVFRQAARTNRAAFLFHGTFWSTYMTVRFSIRVGVSVFLGLLLAASTARAQSIAGVWDATVTVNTLDVPFRFELSGSGADVKGWFFNGDERVASTTGRFESGSLVLTFNEYATTLDATLTDGRLDGRYDRGGFGSYPFHATRFVPAPVADASDVPSIAGLWNLQVKSSKGEDAWRFIVRQSGSEVSAAILRVDGDTGTLTGRYRDGHFVLSHFSGARPALLDVTITPDGTLAVSQNGTAALTGVRAGSATAQRLPQPSDPSRFTSVRDPFEPFRFSFPGLDGTVVANTDQRFAGKVVIVNISGSWCPNCHDEAPFLAELYHRYQQRGLEVVSLSFEEGEQLKNPQRLRAFIKRYHIDYPVLLAGEPKEAVDKLPQAVNLSAFPTTFFLGRDGLVRGAHAGFAGAASGRFHAEQKAEIVATVERLLSEGRTRTSR